MTAPLSVTIVTMNLDQIPPYDFCHSPEFLPKNDGQRTFELNNDTVLGTYFQGSLPRATDEDHGQQGQSHHGLHAAGCQ